MATGVVFDGRWRGPHGIGRYATELQSRLLDPVIVEGHHPVSARGLAELDALVWSARRRTSSDWFLTPGYCPPLSRRGRIAFTIHDLIHLDVPSESDPVKSLYYERVVRPRARSADAVFTVSEFSRQRILEWSGADESRVVVSGNGVSEHFFCATAKPGSGGYVLAVGNRKPHKNLGRLIRAMTQVPDAGLALTGVVDDAVHRMISDAGLPSARVRFLGQVPEADLPNTYRAAVAVAIPSLYEGFGLPALEGLATGTAVVAADATSLPEVVGNDGFMVDPRSVDSIAAGLRAAISSPTSNAVVERRIARARQFSWERPASVVARTMSL